MITIQHSEQVEERTLDLFPSSLSDADSQKMISNKLAVGSPSKENELLFLRSPSLGESSLSRLEAGWAPNHHALGSAPAYP